MPMTCEEQDAIIANISPNLKRNVLSRYGMKWRLLELYAMTPEEREELLDKLYPPVAA